MPWDIMEIIIQQLDNEDVMSLWKTNKAIRKLLKENRIKIIRINLQCVHITPTILQNQLTILGAATREVYINFRRIYGYDYRTQINNLENEYLMIIAQLPINKLTLKGYCFSRRNIRRTVELFGKIKEATFIHKESRQFNNKMVECVFRSMENIERLHLRNMSPAGKVLYEYIQGEKLIELLDETKRHRPYETILKIPNIQKYTQINNNSCIIQYTENLTNVRIKFNKEANDYFNILFQIPKNINVTIYTEVSQHLITLFKHFASFNWKSLTIELKTNERNELNEVAQTFKSLAVVRNPKIAVNIIYQ